MLKNILVDIQFLIILFIFAMSHCSSWSLKRKHIGVHVEGSKVIMNFFMVVLLNYFISNQQLKWTVQVSEAAKGKREIKDVDQHDLVLVPLWCFPLPLTTSFKRNYNRPIWLSFLLPLNTQKITFTSTKAIFIFFQINFFSKILLGCLGFQNVIVHHARKFDDLCFLCLINLKYKELHYVLEKFLTLTLLKCIKLLSRLWLQYKKN